MTETQGLVLPCGASDVGPLPASTSWGCRRTRRCNFRRVRHVSIHQLLDRIWSVDRFFSCRVQIVSTSSVVIRWAMRPECPISLGWLEIRSRIYWYTEGDTLGVLYHPGLQNICREDRQWLLLVGWIVYTNSGVVYRKLKDIDSRYWFLLLPLHSEVPDPELRQYSPWPPSLSKCGRNCAHLLVRLPSQVFNVNSDPPLITLTPYSRLLHGLLRLSSSGARVRRTPTQ